MFPKSINDYVKSLDYNKGSGSKSICFIEENEFAHVGLCLPNIYVNDNNKIIGFIDLDNAELCDKWYDYSWILWSLKTYKYNQILLEKLKLEFNKDKYDKYIPEEYR